MGQQRYKIYVNGKPVFLCSASDLKELGLQPGKNRYVTPFLGKKKQIHQYLDLIDKNREVEYVALYTDEVPLLFDVFKSCFDFLEAAGGYVLDSAGRLLVFYRRDSWDLPKGKIDPGETPEQAAVREVQEETGLAHIELGPFLTHTYHTYRQKGERILKRTWWFRMRSALTDTVPQTEEDIEAIEWVLPDAWLAGNPEVYDSIRDVIRAGLGASPV